MLNQHLPDAWKKIIENHMNPDDFNRLNQTITQRYQTEEVYPPVDQLFSALSHVSPDQVRVVILGQDPYHGTGEANGLAFSVSGTTPIPPSLRNIFKELQADIDAPPPLNGDLSSWSEQGVLLLNTALTVRKDCAGSHSKLGWHTFTDTLIQYLAQNAPPKIFVLWGKHAQEKASIIENAPIKHLCIQSAHPSPLSASRGFLGSRPFSRINEQLIAWGYPPIDWKLPSQESLF